VPTVVMFDGLAAVEFSSCSRGMMVPKRCCACATWGNVMSAASRRTTPQNVCTLARARDSRGAGRGRARATRRARLSQRGFVGVVRQLRPRRALRVSDRASNHAGARDLRRAELGRDSARRKVCREVAVRRRRLALLR